MDDEYIKTTMKKNLDMEKEKLRISADPEYFKLWAANLRGRYNALIKAGFTPRQSIAILTNSSEGPSGSEGGEE